MAKVSAGLLLYRRHATLEVLLAHPGGPLWARKDAGAWTIPKGEAADGEDLLEAAKREFHEETGHAVAGTFRPLAPLKQKSGKTVYAWAIEGDWDPALLLRSNPFTMEWPPKSGRFAEFPEIDRAAWFGVAEARVRILAGQAGFLDQLVALM